MNEVEKRVLSQMRSKLIKEMVVTESFLSAFCHSNVLDDSMSNILKSERNYEQRASKLLELLPSRGSRAFLTLMEILEITNPWLSEKMRAALHDERNKDAKINLHPVVAKSASIEGFGESRLHIDVDIKERAAKYVRANLYHLTDAEQRGVDKWLAHELQRERRRQQFRAPHTMPRDPREFHSSKECQTDTSFMDMRDIFEEIATYLHGVDVVEMTEDVSFGLMQDQIRELLSRTRKLDALFLNCLNKFDDSTKYTMTLPELIDKSVHNEKDLQMAEIESKKATHKLREENEGLKRHVRRLEEHIDRLIQRQTQGMRPQEIQLRHRQDVHFRYTLPAPADSGHFAVNRKFKGEADPEEEKDHDDAMGNDNEVNSNASEGPNLNSVENPYAGQIHSETSKINVGTHDLKRKSSIDFTHHASSKNPSTFVNAAGQKFHKVDPVHYEDQRNVTYPNNWKSNNNAKNHISQHTHTGQVVNKNSKEQTTHYDSYQQVNGYVKEPSLKIRRHASEESIRVAVSREEHEFISTTPIDGVQPEHSSRRNSLDNSHQPKQLSKQPKHGGNADLQARVQKMISERVRPHPNQQRLGSKQESERFLVASGSHMTNDSSYSRGNSGRYRDSSPVYKGHSSLRANHDDSMANDKSQTRVFSKGHGNTRESPDRGSSAEQNILVFQQNQASHNINEEFISIPVPPLGRQPNEQYSRSQRKYPYRSNSSDRYQSGQTKPSLSVVSPGSHSPEYLSDSELVIKKSSLRGKTVRSDKSRSRVRFATPIVKTPTPNRKASARTHRAAHYQMDTASTAIRKNHNILR